MGIRIFQEHAASIDLLLTDVVMPGMNGRDLATKLFEISPALKGYFYVWIHRECDHPTGIRRSPPRVPAKTIHLGCSYQKSARGIGSSRSRGIHARTAAQDLAHTQF